MKCPVLCLGGCLHGVTREVESHLPWLEVYLLPDRPNSPLFEMPQDADVGSLETHRYAFDLWNHPSLPTSIIVGVYEHLNVSDPDVRSDIDITVSRHAQELN